MSKCPHIFGLLDARCMGCGLTLTQILDDRIEECSQPDLNAPTSHVSKLAAKLYEEHEAARGPVGHA